MSDLGCGTDDECDFQKGIKTEIFTCASENCAEWAAIRAPFVAKVGRSLYMGGGITFDSNLEKRTDEKADH